MTPTSYRELKLSNSLSVALIDDGDYPQVCSYVWSQTKRGLVVSHKLGNQSLGRVILNLEPGQDLRYRNGNRLDNRRENLTIRGRTIGVAPCSVEGCVEKVYSKNYCVGHYHRLRYCGSLLLEKPLRPIGTRSGANNPGWRGGERTDPDGRVMLYTPDHPHCMCNGYVLRYRLVMEAHIGRFLTAEEKIGGVLGLKATQDRTFAFSS